MNAGMMSAPDCRAVAMVVIAPAEKLIIPTRFGSTPNSLARARTSRIAASPSSTACWGIGMVRSSAGAKDRHLHHGRHFPPELRPAGRCRHEPIFENEGGDPMIGKPPGDGPAFPVHGQRAEGAAGGDDNRRSRRLVPCRQDRSEGWPGSRYEPRACRPRRHQISAGRASDPTCPPARWQAGSAGAGIFWVKAGRAVWATMPER